MLAALPAFEFQFQTKNPLSLSNFGAKSPLLKNPFFGLSFVLHLKRKC